MNYFSYRATNLVPYQSANLFADFPANCRTYRTKNSTDKISQIATSLFASLLPYICTCRNIDRLSYFFASLIKSQLTLSNSNKRFNTL